VDKFDDTLAKTGVKPEIQQMPDQGAPQLSQPLRDRGARGGLLLECAPERAEGRVRGAGKEGVSDSQYRNCEGG